MSEGVAHRNAWLKRSGKTFLTTAEAFILGALARAIATTFIYPAIRLKIVMQTCEVSSRAEDTTED